MLQILALITFCYTVEGDSCIFFNISYFHPILTIISLITQSPLVSPQLLQFLSIFIWVGCMLNFCVISLRDFQQQLFCDFSYCQHFDLIDITGIRWTVGYIKTQLFVNVVRSPFSYLDWKLLCNNIGIFVYQISYYTNFSQQIFYVIVP